MLYVAILIGWCSSDMVLSQRYHSFNANSLVPFTCKLKNNICIKNTRWTKKRNEQRDKKTFSFYDATTNSSLLHCSKTICHVFGSLSRPMLFTFLSICRRSVELNLFIPLRRLECVMPKLTTTNDIFLLFDVRKRRWKWWGTGQS